MRFRLVFAGAICAACVFISSCASSLYSKEIREKYPLSGFCAQIESEKSKDELEEVIELWMISKTEKGGIWDSDSVILGGRRGFFSKGQGWKVSANLLCDFLIEFSDGKIEIKTQNERVVPYRLNGKVVNFGEMRHDSGFSDEHTLQIREDASKEYEILCDWVLEGIKKAAEE